MPKTNWLRGLLRDLLAQATWETGRYLVTGGGLAAIITAAVAFVLILQRVQVNLLTCLVVFLVAFAILLFVNRRKPQQAVQQLGDQALRRNASTGELQLIDNLFNKIDPRVTGELERPFREQLKDLSGTQEKEDYLIRSAVLSSIYLDYQILWENIFGSQIRALEKLNTRTFKRSELFSFYGEWAIAFPAFYLTYPFDMWLGYMRAVQVIREELDTVTITVRGRDFLRHLIACGRSAEQRVY